MPTSNEYAPSYVPEDRDAYERMMKLFSNATNVDELKKISMLYIMDKNYRRPDIIVAVERTARAHGWKI